MDTEAHFSETRVSIDNLSYYSQLIGLSEKRLPTLKECPAQIFLPKEFLAKPIVAIEQTTKDKCERLQYLKIDSREIIGSEVIVGDQNSADAGFWDMVKLKTMPFFSKKALMEYHTHPDNNYPRMSGTDIASYLATPRSALIRSVFHQYGASFIFQTKESAKLPISSLYTKTDEWWNMHSYKTPQKMAKFWASKNYAYYECTYPWLILPDEVKQNGLIIQRVNL